MVAEGAGGEGATNREGRKQPKTPRSCQQCWLVGPSSSLSVLSPHCQAQLCPSTGWVALAFIPDGFLSGAAHLVKVRPLVSLSAEETKNMRNWSSF